jgi:hypothetical protein
MRFKADMRAPEEDHVLSQVKMVGARYCCSGVSQFSDFEFAASFHHLLKGQHLSTAQALELCSLIPPEEQGKRVTCVEACINKLANPRLSQKLLDTLNDAQYEQLQKRMGMLALSFTAANPTGHHRFELSKPPERECAVRLVRIKNTEAEQEAKEQAACEGRVGGKRIQFDRVWRNAFLNRKPLVYNGSMSLPSEGILELDFVQISKVPAKQQAISNQELHHLIEHEWLDRHDGLELVIALRAWTNVHYFTCAQVSALITMIKRAELLREKTEAAKRFAQEQATVRAQLQASLARATTQDAAQATRISLKQGGPSAQDDLVHHLVLPDDPAQHSLLGALSPLRRMVQGVLFSAFSS